MKEQAARSRDAKSVAQDVRAFYEGHPYPPPIDNLDKYRLWGDPQRRRAEFHLSWPFRTFDEDFSILVAGCGTSQAAKHAMRWPARSEEHTSELQSLRHLVCRLLLEKKNKT